MQTQSEVQYYINKTLKESRLYKYHIADLKKKFEERGMKVSSGWVYRQEKKGVLVLPRSTTNLKTMGTLNRQGSVRVMTRIQLEEIVKAFLPGGKGFWKPKSK